MAKLIKEKKNLHITIFVGLRSMLKYYSSRESSSLSFFLPVPRRMFTRIGCARVGKGNFSGGKRRNESSRKARQLKVSAEIRECVKMEKIIGDEKENIIAHNVGEFSGPRAHLMKIAARNTFLGQTSFFAYFGLFVSFLLFLLFRLSTRSLFWFNSKLLL